MEASSGQPKDSGDAPEQGRSSTAGLLPEQIVSDETLVSIGFDVTSPALEMITDPDGRVRLLRLFCEEHDTSAVNARESVVAGDHVVARDVLHKLMGTSATIGLAELHRAVLALQDEIHTDPDAVNAATLDAFTGELDRVMSALAPLCEE